MLPGVTLPYETPCMSVTAKPQMDLCAEAEISADETGLSDHLLSAAEPRVESRHRAGQNEMSTQTLNS